MKNWIKIAMKANLNGNFLLSSENGNNNSLNEQLGGWEFCQNLDIFENAHAVLILTEWDEFKNINWKPIAKKMVAPAWVFDSRSILDPDNIKDAGLNLWRLGDGSKSVDNLL